MICRACEGEIDEAAAFCPRCGADPLLGDPWPETLGLDDERRAALPGLDELGDCPLDDLVLPVLLSAHALQACEGLAAGVAADARRGTWPLRARRQRQAGADWQELEASVSPRVQLFQTLAFALLERCQEQMSQAEFEARYPQLAWACLHEYASYLDLRSEAEARDVFTRRTKLGLARWGVELTERWAPEDERFQLAYNALLLTPFPGDGVVQMPGMERMQSGPDCYEGILQVALTPALWRFWGDGALAPSALLLVYQQANPLGAVVWDEAGTSATLGEVAECQAARLEGIHGVEVERNILQLGGLPAVSCELRHPWEGGLLVQRYVWVYAGAQVYFLRGLTPAAAPEYVVAVHAAIAGFVPGVNVKECCQIRNRQ